MTKWYDVLILNDYQLHIDWIPVASPCEEQVMHSFDNFSVVIMDVLSNKLSISHQTIIINGFVKSSW